MPRSKGGKIIDISRAFFVRILFIIHLFFTIWAGSCVSGSKEVWILSIFGLFLVIEGFYNAIKRQGREPKWFSLCVFIFLLGVVPPIWLLQIDMFECLTNVNNNGSCNGLSGKNYICSLVEINTIFNRKPMFYSLEEILLLLLIVGKWLLPRGSVSLDQHSQLLFIYFGFSFDMVDLFVLFEEKPIINKPAMKYIIMMAWTLSLFQFTLVKTALKRKKVKLNENEKLPVLVEYYNRCCMSEIWQLLTTVFMHDGPYLLIRLYCLIGLKILSYNLIFFTVKNMLTVILQFYRFSVLVLNCRTPDENMSTDVSLSSRQGSVSRIVPIVTELPLGSNPFGGNYHGNEKSRSLNSVKSNKSFDSLQFNFISNV